MIESLRQWWRGHSAGERGLMTLLGVIILVVFLWLGVWRPVTYGLTAGWQRESAALDRFGAVKAKVEALKRLPTAPAQGAAHVPIDQLVGQTAAEAGFTLDRASPQGSNQMSVNIASARMGPLLSWIARLEAAGVTVQTISIVPGATEGTVTVQAVFQEAAR